MTNVHELERRVGLLEDRVTRLEQTQNLTAEALERQNRRLEELARILDADPPEDGEEVARG